LEKKIVKSTFVHNKHIGSYKISCLVLSENDLAYYLTNSAS
jgi:hypothetical protein